MEDSLHSPPRICYAVYDARTKDIEKPLFLRRFNVPYWGGGHNDMYRLEQVIGRFNIVGTTVKDPLVLIH